MDMSWLVSHTRKNAGATTHTNQLELPYPMVATWRAKETLQPYVVAQTD